MKNAELRKAMQELGVDRDSFRVLGLLPLVYVAWADGRVQRCERTLIQDLATNKGWLGKSGEALLESWLEQPPPESYVKKGLEVLRALADERRGLGAGVDHDTLRSLVTFSRNVAVAAGGIFGFGDPITDEEEAALVEIAHALGLDESSSWQEIAERAEQHERDLPPGPPGHLLVGSMPEFARDPLGFMLDSANRYGDVVFFRIAGEKIYMLRKPEHIEHVFQTNGSNYVRGFEYHNLGKLIGDSLLTTDGEVWRKLRRMSQPAFHKQHLAGFADTIGEVTARMLERWRSFEDGQVIDVAPEMMRLTLEIIGLLLCSKDLSDDASEIGQAVGVAIHHANEAMTNPLRIPDVVPTPDNLRFKRAMKVFDDLLYSLITERRAQGDGAPKSDLLGMLMAVKDEETGEGLNDEQLRNEMLTFLIAGHETTSIALTWTFYALSKHPVIARRVVAEVDEQLAGERPGFADTAKCSYANMVIDEAMRLYPPAWALSREAVSDDEIGGYHIPKGALVFLAPWVTHRSPELWPNPEGFDPERFNPDAVAARHKDAYFPFAAGPHKCIGIGLAMMELHLIVPMVLQKYRLDLECGFEPQFDPQVTLRAKNGMRMSVHKR
jgi:cytochrome P450